MAEERLKNQPKDRFHRNDDDDYFAHVEGEQDEPAAERHDDDEEDDPLEAYMRTLEGGDDQRSDAHSQSSSPDKAKDESEKAQAISSNEPDKRGVRLDFEGTDAVEESYYKIVEQRKSQQGDSDDLDEKQNLVEYDKDGNIISVKRVKKEIDPLPPIDHSMIQYDAFKKVFYEEHEEIEKLSLEQVEDLRAKLEIKVSGNDPPKPVCSFAHFKFDEQLMRVIRRSEYTRPTPIQAQAIPAALSGRNIIGIAMTGSGKTAAYLWPMIVHIMGQPNLKKGDGPIGLILVPTRELALQVYSEAKKFSSSYNIAVVCAYGGGSKYEQSKDLEAGAEIVVATPGRIIDLIKMEATNFRRVTYLVLDEADRFFEMGFEVQVRSICDQIRPDRQTLLFSATFKHHIEQLARTVTADPVKIVQKSLGEANEDVTQHVIILPDVSKKWEWLLNRLVEFISSGSVLIFVTRIVNSEEVHKKLVDQGHDALLLHGYMQQSERNGVITAFKRKEKNIMVATDVAARGLDITHIKTVINYDVARDIDTHIHRVGRTGRAGSKGDAYTLLTEQDKEFAGHLVKNLESSNQIVDEQLVKLASRSQVFRKSRGNKQQHRHSSHHSHHHHHHGRNDSRSHDSAGGSQRGHNYSDRDRYRGRPNQGETLYGRARDSSRNDLIDREYSSPHQGHNTKRYRWN